MKFLKIIVYLLLTGFVLVLALGLFARHTYPIERSLEIDAPRAVVLEQIRYFANFKKWSPWNTLDPNMKETIEGTDGEVGAVNHWEGNRDVGAGSQTIQSISNDQVRMEVVLQKPWKSTSQSVFTLEEIGEKTKVTWHFNMYIGFPWNAMAMFTDVNAGVGKDYARGLGNLKKICEQIVHPATGVLKLRKPIWPFNTMQASGTRSNKPNWPHFMHDISQKSPQRSKKMGLKWRECPPA